MIAELLEALGEGLVGAAWPGRDDGGWRWVYWGALALFVVIFIGFVVWVAQ